MKKAKRFLTGLLSAALALSLCAMPAMAAEGGETPSTTPPQDVWTQDFGSITIHKYEWNGKNGEAGTGEQGDEKHLPSNTTADGKTEKPTPLAGATFSIYQVMDRAALRNYYDGTDGQTKVTVDTYLNGTKDAIKSDETYSTAVATETTGDDGIASFPKLALGLYVVVETDTPDKVTSPVKPFLVSVPMTKASSLNEWLYDIHVYPKNGTTYGEVKIVKTGRVGNGAENKLKGVNFTLEKWDATANDWKSVTASDKDGTIFNLKTNESGEISVNGLSQGKYRFIEQSIDEDNNYIIDQTPIVFEVTKDGEIVYKNGKPKKAISIPVINESPDVEKNVIKDSSPKTEADYSVGDKVPYQITVTVPENITKLTTFTVSDTPNHLKYNEDATLTCNGAAVSADVYTIATVGEDVPENGFKITFKPADMAEYAGQKIIINYTATLLSTADQTGAGNRNDVSLVYSNNIGVDGDGKPTEGDKKEIHDSTFVYTFKVKVNKIADDTQKGLENVEFDLYKEDESGTVTGDAAKALGLDPTKKWIKVNKTSLKTDANGYVEQGGLANGEYYLVETKTASGYNLLKAPVKVTLSIQAQTEWVDTYIYDDNGNMLKHTVDKKSTTFSGGDEGGKLEYTITVVNRKGFDLPTTGGFGTLLFSGIGVLLVVAGVGVLLSLKKKNRA